MLLKLDTLNRLTGLGYFKNRISNNKSVFRIAIVIEIQMVETAWRKFSSNGVPFLRIL